MDDLVYDRTQNDVNYALNHQDSTSFLKGSYNYTDLNRVETWCEYVAQQLNLYGYIVNITTKTDWEMTDFPTKAQMQRIRNNVLQLKNAYVSVTNVPNDLDKMTYQKANYIEKILNEIDLNITNMIAGFLFSNTFYGGESEGLLP